MTISPFQAAQAARTAASEARRIWAAGGPRSKLVHLASASNSHTVLAVDGTRVFEVDSETYVRIQNLIDSPDGEGTLRELLLQFGLTDHSTGLDEVPSSPPIRALSLAVAQKCNLGCSYCYANQGDFGGVAKNMPVEVAFDAVDLLFSEAAAGDRVNLAFLGGEPLINRSVLREATKRAARSAVERDVRIGFSITTNGTLLEESDAEFFESYGFAVTISLDGPQRMHDQLRPYKSGAGSFDRIMANVRPLLNRQQRMQVSARVTVTPVNLALRETLDEFIAAGFHSVGFSPLLNAVNGLNEMTSGNWEVMLTQMIDCGMEFERRLVNGQRYPFANVVNALREIHKGTHRPYPCGAGAGYLGVSADGDLAACHRFVGDTTGAMGTLMQGIDRESQARWLSERHVHKQEPCRSCWARYLCGGGCHHEVISRGRPACDYIRGWLHFCLEAYSRLYTQVPGWFSSLS